MFAEFNVIFLCFPTTERKSRVPKAGGAVQCVVRVTVILTEDFTKTATRPLASVAARYKHT